MTCFDNADGSQLDLPAVALHTYSDMMNSGNKGEVIMASVKFQILDCPNDEEHIIRRLGTAVVLQWSSLPKEVQGRLLQQAVFVHDRYQTVQLQEQISMFISKHKLDQAD